MIDILYQFDFAQIQPFAESLVRPWAKRLWLLQQSSVAAWRESVLRYEEVDLARTSAALAEWDIHPDTRSIVAVDYERRAGKGDARVTLDDGQLLGGMIASLSLLSTLRRRAEIGLWLPWQCDDLPALCDAIDLCDVLLRPIYTDNNRFSEDRIHERIRGAEVWGKPVVPVISMRLLGEHEPRAIESVAALARVATGHTDRGIMLWGGELDQDRCVAALRAVREVRA